MNTHTTTHKAKVRHLCSFLVLCLHLVHGAVPGPCKHSVTKDNLLNLKRLIGNQLQNGCPITYSFTEHQNLSEVCYVKAAFPHILEMLNAHFDYERDSDNYRYTNSLKTFIYNIYSQKCIPQINEEVEENPVKFARVYTTSARVGLEKIEEIIQTFKNLLTKSDRPIEWNCEDEYAKDIPESSTVIPTKTLATPECQCSCTNSGSTHLTTIMQTRSSPTASTTTSGPPLTSALTHQNGGSKASEPVANYEAPNSSQSQPLPVSPGLSTKLNSIEKLHSSVHGDFPKPIFPTYPDTINKNPVGTGSAILSPITPFTKLPAKLQRPIPVLQPATSQPSHRTFTAHRSERNTALALVKRSLDAKIQGTLSDFYYELQQSWTASTPSNPSEITKDLGIEITTEESDTQLQSILMDKNIARNSVTAQVSINIIEDVSESRPAVKSPVDVNTPTHFLTRPQMAASLPENVFKTVKEATHCQDSRCQNNSEVTEDQMSRGQGEGHSGNDIHKREHQVTHISTDAMLIITSVSVLLLLITVLFYKQQRNIRWPFYKPRGSKDQRRSAIYDKEI